MRLSNRQTPANKAAGNRKYRYGIMESDFQTILEKQDNRCDLIWLSII